MQSNNTFPKPKQTSSNRETASMASVFRPSAPSVVTIVEHSNVDSHFTSRAIKFFLFEAFSSLVSLFLLCLAVQVAVVTASNEKKESLFSSD